MGRTTSASERSLWGARGHRYEPYANARSRRQRTQSPGPSAFPRPSEGKLYLPSRPVSSQLHSLNDERIGNEAHLEAVPPNLPSVRTPSQHMGAEPSGSTAEASETANHARNTPGSERKPRRKRKEFKAFLATVGLPAEIGNLEFNQILQLSANSSGRGPTRPELVPQTWYSPPNRQEDWNECAPIEFGGIKLTDAANEVYEGLQGARDKVFNYEGVGSAITCRLAVRRASEAPQIRFFTLPSLPSLPGMKLEPRR